MSSIGPSPAPGGSVTLTVKGPDGKVLTTTKAQVGANLRKTLQGAKVDVYDLVGKLTNCNGTEGQASCRTQMSMHGAQSGCDLTGSWCGCGVCQVGGSA